MKQRSSFSDNSVHVIKKDPAARAGESCRGAAFREALGIRHLCVVRRGSDMQADFLIAIIGGLWGFGMFIPLRKTKWMAHWVAQHLSGPSLLGSSHSSASGIPAIPSTLLRVRRDRLLLTAGR